MDEKRSVEIVRKIVKAFKNKEGIFAKHDNKLAYFNIPDEKSKALFAIYAISIDYGMRADFLFRNLNRLLKEMPEIFNPSFLVEKFDEKSLALFLRRRVRVRFSNEAAKRWLTLSKLLLEKYEGDARKIFEGDDALQVLGRIKEFRGFGPKISSLFFKFMVTLGFGKNLKNVEKIPIPVDTHLFKLAFRLGVVKAYEGLRYQKYAPKISKMWNRAAERAKVSWMDLNDALWILGAYGCAARECKICPVLKYCIRPFLQKKKL